jgi:hypothetical protein
LHHPNEIGRNEISHRKTTTEVPKRRGELGEMLAGKPGKGRKKKAYTESWGKVSMMLRKSSLAGLAFARSHNWRSQDPRWANHKLDSEEPWDQNSNVENIMKWTENGTVYVS